jgi:hypothetical protein
MAERLPFWSAAVLCRFSQDADRPSCRPDSPGVAGSKATQDCRTPRRFASQTGCYF